MTYKNFRHIKRFQTTLILLVCFMVVSMSVSRCGCGNYDQSKRDYANKGSINMEVTPTELQGDQRTTTITFIVKTPGESKRSISLASYQLQVSFLENTRVSYSSGHQRDKAVQSQEKVKLENY